MKTQQIDNINQTNKEQKEEGNQSFLKFIGLFVLIVGALCVAAHYLFLA